ncbi:MAG: DUF2480 family protein [Flavobacterium sp.]
MEDEIINKVAASALEVFDLEDYYPKRQRIEIDIAQWLIEGFLLKEKDFRAALKLHDWSQYENAYVAINCSTDAIVPAWTKILIALYLNEHATFSASGTIEELDSLLYREILDKIDFSVYQDKMVIIKGCARKPVPVNAYIMASQHLQQYAKGIMYGEACSAVPLFKKSKTTI